MTADELDQIREIPIDAVLASRGVRRVGKRYRCFAHADKHPSATIWRNRLHCWPCERVWSTIDVVMDLDGLDLLGAVRRLGAEFSIPLSNATPEQRAAQAAVAEDRPDAHLWALAAQALAEEALEVAAAMDPVRAGLTQLVSVLRDERSALQDYRAWRERWPELTAAILCAGRQVDERLQVAAAHWLMGEAGDAQ